MHRELTVHQITICNRCFMVWLLYLHTGSAFLIFEQESLAKPCALHLCIGSDFCMLAGYAIYLLLRAGLDSAWESESALCAGCWYLQWLAPAHMDPRDRALEPSSWLSAELCSINCSPSGNCTQATTLIEKYCAMHGQIWSCSCD